MRILKWLLGIIVVLVVVFGAGAYLLPREITVERSVSIDAAPNAVFPYVNSLKATQEWSPWLDRDPNVQLSFTGPEAGVGAAMSWSSDSPQVGVGRQEIMASVENQSVQSALDFGDMGTAEAAFELVGAGAATDVTWTLVVDMGNSPMGRWMGLMMDGLVGADYEQGLSNLKSVVEGG